jgi:hypothetical protein
MMTAISPLALLLVVLAPAASDDEPLPGRDGNYQLTGGENVEGTVWQGERHPGEIFIVRFERGGTLCYTTNSGTWRNGTWKQTGNSIYLEMNKRYAEYRGVILGDRMFGDAGNINAVTWKWDVKRVGPIGSEKTPPLAPHVSPPGPLNIRPPFIGRDPSPRMPPWRW